MPLQAALPFASKPKQQAAAKRQNLDQRRAVVREPGERKVAGLISQLQALRNQRTQRRRAAQAVRNQVAPGWPLVWEPQDARVSVQLCVSKAVTGLGDRGRGAVPWWRPLCSQWLVVAAGSVRLPEATCPAWHGQPGQDES